MEFKTLYKKTTTGAVQAWRITVDGATIITQYRHVGGAIQETRDRILQGKNLGRANATTPEQQAYAEALARFEKQKKKGYVTTEAEARAGKYDTSVILGGVAPMLAQKFADHGDKIVYPCFIQPKLDGMRCIAMIRGGKATLWSRTRKPIHSVPHVVRALEATYTHDTEVTLDGELYVHGMDFEKLISLVRPATPRPGHEEVAYHIYDVVSPAPFSQRAVALAEIVPDAHPLRRVQTLVAHDLEAVTSMTEGFVEEEGYEGSIVRQATAPYQQGVRSYGLHKVKTMLDEEFRILDVEEGRGKLAGCAIFVCEARPGVEFRCKLEGSTDLLRSYFQNPQLWRGKGLTVKFQNLTKEGIPRFPVGVAVRDYEG